MKTKFLKTVLPAIVLMLAVASAFAFKNVEGKALLAPEIGWVNLEGSPCEVPVMCDNNPALNVICKTIVNNQVHQAFGKPFPGSMSCITVLYRMPMN
ncbi:MAG TPA: DUF6520 family protein [Gelidibacter sp.]|uniref:DUF6520 family protein n=1 Tax=Gelidibacter sp. TaxID=2018083 RepID=UPI002CAC20B8|nr:DUF6520 family protein [Gelidibacter sp.]HXJ99558.1 DUF6520 family protein [Gelidibacter sp.]